MKRSQLLAHTLRDNPAEAEVVSHQLLMRAGYIRRLSSGIYNYLPLMLRVLHKIETIVREEMNQAGAQELRMPILQPAEIWQESGRWEVYGKELMRLKDRHERDCVLGPTHEEVITSIARSELKSYRQLPANLYQIQNKYRDEIRPRFGLLRGREFIMKDAYSFHSSWEDLEREYQVMADAYTRIFERCGLETRMVQSDSGAIGGSVSHEFMVLTRILPGEQESGENDVFYCDTCTYAANSNRAESILPPALTDGSDLFPAEEERHTPNTHTIEQLCKFLGCPPSLICKALVYIKDETHPFMVLIRGDRDAEEVKLANAVGANEIRLANDEEIQRYFGVKKGFIGLPDDKWAVQNHPEGYEEGFQNCFLSIRPPTENKFIPLYLDTSVVSLNNFVIANNKAEHHKVGFSWLSYPNRTLGETEQRNQYSVDVCLAKVGDGCPKCAETGEVGKLQMTRGIEVGNIFNLGTKYSAKMGATFTSESGEEQPFIMGCYGIGVSRTAAAAVERFHDKDGIVWPMGIAPYHVVVVPVNPGDETQMALATQVYEALLQAGIEVVIDDRDERAGMKFKDADLIGFPIRITAGKKAGEGLLEVKLRDTKEPQDLAVDAILPFVQKTIQTWKPQLG